MSNDEPNIHDLGALLLAYAGGELDPCLADRLREQLAADPALAAEIAALGREEAAIRRAVSAEQIDVRALEAKVREALAQCREDEALRRAVLAEPVSVDNLAARIRARLTEAEGAAQAPRVLSPGRARARRRPRLYPPAVLAAAASVLLVVGLLWPAGPGDPARAFAARHHVCIKYHFEHAPGGELVPNEAFEEGEGWTLTEARALLARMDVPAERLADLEARGWRFRNGHYCKLGGGRFLHAFYSREGEIVSVYVGLDGSARKMASGRRPAEVGGLTLESADAVHGVAVMTEAGAPYAEEFLADYRRALGAPPAG